MSNIDFNKSAKACPTCSEECEKINKRLNNRKLSQVKNKEIPQLLKVFNKSEDLFLFAGCQNKGLA